MSVAHKYRPILSSFFSPEDPRSGRDRALDAAQKVLAHDDKYVTPRPASIRTFAIGRHPTPPGFPTPYHIETLIRGWQVFRLPEFPNRLASRSPRILEFIHQLREHNHPEPRKGLVIPRRITVLGPDGCVVAKNPVPDPLQRRTSVTYCVAGTHGHVRRVSPLCLRQCSPFPCGHKLSKCFS
jgi:hypothetical protein